MSDNQTIINVTKSYLPPLEEYLRYLECIWESNQLTNNGPLLKELEAKLKEFLGVKHLFLVSNGTIALQIAIKALGLHGEIVTTPFSYVATTSSIVWEGCQPVFVDIDPQTLCIDPNLIEAAITPQTTAILAVHVYGHPCNVELIQAIAERHGLKVIYDAAHAFGVRYKSRSLLVHGDIATLSFHATKLFHTVEGGALVTNGDEVAHRIAYMRNFGHKSPEQFWGVGINGKNSEFHAAMGLTILPHVSELIRQRQKITQWYDTGLAGVHLQKPVLLKHTYYNFAYYPIIFPSEEHLRSVCDALQEIQVFPRRYFFPSLSELFYVTYQYTPISEDIAKRVLCLPLYPELAVTQVQTICTMIERTMGR